MVATLRFIDDAFKGYFLTKIQGLSWNDYYGAYKHQLINTEALVDYALWIIEHEDQFDDEVLMLAGESPTNVTAIEDLVEAIIKGKGKNIFDKEKWLYISLLWLYQNKENISNLREEIDSIYTHFNYPESIKHLVSYMPCEGEVKPILTQLGDYIHSSPYSSRIGTLSSI